jgi:phosphopantetheinyl transferase (holo-ACP synthase)
MKSTGNDIISLNAINETRTKQSGFYSKILSPTEKTLYDQTGFKKIPFENFVWLLWSIKESAHKYLQRITPGLIFSPTKFAVNHLQIPIGYDIKNFGTRQVESIGFDDLKVLKGTVIFGSDTLFLRSVMYNELIISVVNRNENFESIGWGVKLIEKSDPDYQSMAVRAFLVNKLNALFTADNLVISKNQHGIPIVLKGDKELTIPISLSHHDQLIAYSYNFGD